MSARRQIIAALSEDSMGGIATLQDVARAEQLVDAHHTEVTRGNAALLDDRACDADFTHSPDFCSGLREGAELLTRKAGEKASATPAPTATPTVTVFDPLPSYLHAIGHAGSESERVLYAAYQQAIAEVARLQAETDASVQPPAGEAAPTDTNRRARLLHEMALGGRWKSGDVVRWYERQGLTGLGVRAARHDLAVLRDSGAITQHDEKGVRFYTLNSQKGSRS